MADFTQELRVKFSQGTEYDIEATISTDSTVIFRGEEIRVYEIEDYVAGIETELATAYLTSSIAHEDDILKLKRAHELEVIQLQETIAMYEAALASAKQGD